MYIVTPETIKGRNSTIFRPVLISLFASLVIITAINLFSLIAYTEITNFFFGVLSICATFYLIKLLSTKIIIDKDALHHSIMHIREHINWDDITESKTSWNFTTRNTDWVFITKDEKIFKIPLHYFSKQHKQKLAKILIHRCQLCRVSDTIKRYADGDFQWYDY